MMKEVPLLYKDKIINVHGTAQLITEPQEVKETHSHLLQLVDHVEPELLRLSEYPSSAEAVSGMREKVQ